MIYPFEAVAEAILHAAAHPTRNFFIGSQVKLGVVAAAIGAGLSWQGRRRHQVGALAVK